jgi:hypothetical protein
MKLYCILIGLYPPARLRQSVITLNVKCHKYKLLELNLVFRNLDMHYTPADTLNVVHACQSLLKYLFYTFLLFTLTQFYICYLSTRTLPGGKGKPERKANNLTAICESIV